MRVLAGVMIGMLAVAGCARAQVPSAAVAPGGPLAAADFVVRGISAEVDSARVVALLGQPDSTWAEDDPYTPGAHFYHWRYPQMEVQLGGRQVLGVTLTAPGVPTARGLRVGDPAARVVALYGEPVSRDEAVWEYRDPADATGHHDIRVTVLDGTVREIFVGWSIE
jgi:hypothetical protein